ncbi:MAG: hypothetical protein AAFN78_03875 [Pseudomonadota bacterium]
MKTNSICCTNLAGPIALAIVLIMLLAGCAGRPVAPAPAGHDGEQVDLVVTSVHAGTPQCGAGKVWFCERHRGAGDNCGCAGTRVFSPVPGTSPWQRF